NSIPLVVMSASPQQTYNFIAHLTGRSQTTVLVSLGCVAGKNECDDLQSVILKITVSPELQTMWLLSLAAWSVRKLTSLPPEYRQTSVSPVWQSIMISSVEDKPVS